MMVLKRIGLAVLLLVLGGVVASSALVLSDQVRAARTATTVTAPGGCGGDCGNCLAGGCAQHLGQSGDAKPAAAATPPATPSCPLRQAPKGGAKAACAHQTPDGPCDAATCASCPPRAATAPAASATKPRPAAAKRPTCDHNCTECHAQTPAGKCPHDRARR